MRVALAVLALVLAATVARASERAHVYVVVVDGLDARLATPERLPRLSAILAEERGRSSRFAAALAVMPARTNPNHVSLLTASYPDAHGVTGNAYWGRTPGTGAAKLDAPRMVEVETLFTVIETSAPERATLGAFGKPKLARLFAEAPERQRAPDVLWSPDAEPGLARDPASGYGADADTMAAALRLMAEREPDLAVLNLSDVDRTAHARGPDDPECAGAVAGADRAIGRLADDLRARGRWGRSVLVVTADHGFTALAPTAERPQPVIRMEDVFARAGVTGVRVIADGGVEHVYAEGLAATADEAGAAAAALVRAATVARATPGVAQVLARLPLAGVASLGDAHPDWHLDHERTGELLLVAAPGHQFVDPWSPVDAALLGNHGAPGERAVPLFVTGGWPGLAAAPAAAPAPTLADVGATVARLLGVRQPRGVDGRPVPAGRAGRVIEEVLAPQSPH